MVGASFVEGAMSFLGVDSMTGESSLGGGAVGSLFVSLTVFGASFLLAAEGSSAAPLRFGALGALLGCCCG